jgi:hypothetical protein
VVAESPVPEGGWVAPDGSIVQRAEPALPPGGPSPRHGDGGRRAAIVAGVILVGLGALFLAGEFVPSFDASVAWPTASVILGVVLVVLSIRPARD